MFKKSSIEEFGNSIISWMQRKYNILHLGVLACMWLVVLLVQKKKTRRNRISISLKGSTACFCSVLSALIQTKLKNYQPHQLGCSFDLGHWRSPTAIPWPSCANQETKKPTDGKTPLKYDLLNKSYSIAYMSHNWNAN